MIEVVLLSGGYDSTVLLKQLSKKHKNLKTFHANFKYEEGKQNIGESRLLNADFNTTIELAHTKEDYIPSRNSILVLSCVNFLLREYPNETFVIYIGLIKNFPRFPDGTHSWVDIMNSLLKIEFGDQVQLKAPFIDKTKDDVYLIGQSLGVDIANTFSCNFEINGVACGVCNNCKWRAQKRYPKYERRFK